MKRYTIGIDFGTLSARALLLDTQTGKTVATAVKEYAHGVMDETLPSGKTLPAQSALQHPADYLEALRVTVSEVLRVGNISPEEIAGVGIDFTSCTLVAMAEDGTPLCMTEQYADEPQAYVKLWKHHASNVEADRMTELAVARGEKWLAAYGGRISPEWAFPKILETLRRAPAVYRDTARFCEAGDWLSFLLTGEESQTAAYASFKFCWSEENGYPSNAFLTALDPRLDGIVGTKVSTANRTPDRIAGHLNARGAELTGLCEGTPLAMPMLDADAAMPALGVTHEGELLLILGTSGVALVHSKQAHDIEGICGRAENGVIPGLCTYEAGQAGLGDGFDWFVKHNVPETYHQQARKRGMSIHQYLREKAKRLRVGESGLLALDWLNGNRSVLQDSTLSGMMLGMHLGTRPEEIYRAWIEATAFGMKMVVDTYAASGIRIEHVKASGGIAKKDDMMMQIYADVFDREICVMDAEQAGALGSAIYASAAGGLFPSVEAASDALVQSGGTVYRPIAENVKRYAYLYGEYKGLYDYFGRGENRVMTRLREFSQT